MAPENMVEVVAAVIEQNGLIMIGQRRAGSRHAHKWEFPGGKLEAGETPREALARELREELAIEAIVGEEIERYDFAYGTNGTTRLYFFRVAEYTGEPKNLAFEQIAWEHPAKFRDYDFLDGDLRFLQRFL